MVPGPEYIPCLSTHVVAGLHSWPNASRTLGNFRIPGVQSLSPERVSWLRPPAVHAGEANANQAALCRLDFSWLAGPGASESLCWPQ